jgi:hypothetical protein
MYDTFVWFLWAYSVTGSAVALAFLFWGFDKVDKAAHGAYAVRPLLLPGLVLLWPMVFARWWQLRQGDRH